MEGRISAASSPLPMSNPYSPKYERNVTALRVFAIRSHLVAWISGCGRTEPDPCSGSYDADVLRASQLQYSVQHVGRGGHLARLSPLCLRPQPISEDALPARDVGLHESAPVVPRRLLPAHAATLGDASQMLVALRRRGLGGIARHRIRARRDDHSRSGMAGRNLGVDIVAVVGAVAGDGRHCPIDPVEQGTDLGAVVG